MKESHVALETPDLKESTISTHFPALDSFLFKKNLKVSIKKYMFHVCRIKESLSDHVCVYGRTGRSKKRWMPSFCWIMSHNTLMLSGMDVRAVVVFTGCYQSEEALSLLSLFIYPRRPPSSLWPPSHICSSPCFPHLTAVLHFTFLPPRYLFFLLVIHKLKRASAWRMRSCRPQQTPVCAESSYSVSHLLMLCMQTQSRLFCVSCHADVFLWTVIETVPSLSGRSFNQDREKINPHVLHASILLTCPACIMTFITLTLTLLQQVRSVKVFIPVMATGWKILRRKILRPVAMTSCLNGLIDLFICKLSQKWITLYFQTIFMVDSSSKRWKKANVKKGMSQVWPLGRMQPMFKFILAYRLLS